ncbi:hypothetical protein [Bacillus pinisoli]|uniref:hypothetical protein n=1 Tax=Bacillus pinisoli TaxID=2901866 RepID=UPI001FF6758A|nr:hypothetical protein [Bacillus pinisoli]
MILKLFFALNILTAFQSNFSQDIPSQTPNPRILSISTDYSSNGNWIQIPKATKEITFKIKAEHTETVLFWLIPTGTQKWTERKLIGYDIKENERDDNFSFTWNIDKPYLQDHIHIQAIGEGNVTNDIINLSMN